MAAISTSDGQSQPDPLSLYQPERSEFTRVRAGRTIRSGRLKEEDVALRRTQDVPCRRRSRYHRTGVSVMSYGERLDAEVGRRIPVFDGRIPNGGTSVIVLNVEYAREVVSARGLRDSIVRTP